MKKTALFLALVGSLFIFTQARAESQPCKEIKAACEAGGYTKGGHNKKTNTYKGLYKDCILKIKEGQTVEGVTVPSETVAACKAKKAKRDAKKAAGSAPPTSTTAK